MCMITSLEHGTNLTDDLRLVYWRRLKIFYDSTGHDKTGKVGITIYRTRLQYQGDTVSVNIEMNGYNKKNSKRRIWQHTIPNAVLHILRQHVITTKPVGDTVEGILYEVFKELVEKV